MSANVRPSCVICAWREACQKKYSIANPALCPDFSADLSIKDLPARSGVKLVVEGAPGSGKSTLVERVLTKLGDEVKAGGFFTREMRKAGQRTGFKIVTLDKLEAVLSAEGLPGGHKVGRYTVNLEAMETVAVPSIERALSECELVVIDEVGRMELFSNRFREMVSIAFDSDVAVLATAPIDGDPFVEELKGRDGVRVLRLEHSGREDALEQAVGIIRGR